MEVSCGRRGLTSLLLLSLCVASAAAANCPQPPAMPNIVLSNEALLMNTFPEGSEVKLECGNGYVPESGSGIITCVDKSWTEPDLHCKKKDCGPPTPQPHMSFNTSAGTLFGALVKVLCDKGFQVIGRSYKQCYASGWNGRAKCETITCDKPAEVTNGRNSWESEEDPTYGEIVHYVCDDGYALVGKASATCSDYGQYNSQPPLCEAVMTEDRTTKTTTTTAPTSTPPPEATTSTESPSTPTPHRDNTFSTRATPAVSPSAPGGGYVLTAGGRATTTGVTSTMPPSFQGDEMIETNKDTGYVAVIVSVICITLAVLFAMLCLHKYLLKRKGSYDTREDLKPELLHFQNPRLLA